MEQDNVQNVENTGVPATTENTGTPSAEEKGEKTFTQSEFTKALKDEVARKTKGMPTKEELKEFNEWKESQKTEAEKQVEVIKENETLKMQLKEERSKTAVANAGVDSKFQRFVISEVSQIEGEFNDNLKKYLEENPQFLAQKEEKKPTTTGFPQNNTNQAVSEEKTYLDKKYANNPYYKK